MEGAAWVAFLKSPTKFRGVNIFSSKCKTSAPSPTAGQILTGLSTPVSGPGSLGGRRGREGDQALHHPGVPGTSRKEGLTEAEGRAPPPCDPEAARVAEPCGHWDRKVGERSPYPLAQFARARVSTAFSLGVLSQDFSQGEGRGAALPAVQLLIFVSSPGASGSSAQAAGPRGKGRALAAAVLSHRPLNNWRAHLLAVCSAHRRRVPATPTAREPALRTTRAALGWGRCAPEARWELGSAHGLSGSSDGSARRSCARPEFSAGIGLG